MDIMLSSYHNIFKLIILSLFIVAGGVVLYEVGQSFLNYYPTQNYEVSVSSEVAHGEKSTHSHPQLLENDNTSGMPNIPIEKSIMSTSIRPNEVLMKLSLRGTVNAGMENAAAIIENSEEQKQKLYKIGNIIAGGVLSQILKEKVVIRIDRRDYVLIMDSISRPEEDESIVIIRRQDLENSLENIENFMSQVRIKPQFFNDGTGGLIVKDIRQGALLDQLGFRNGDVIQEINGVVIQNPYRLAVIYEGLKAVPFNILSFDTIGSNAKDILLGIDSQAGGIVNQTSKVLHKIESGEKIPVRFTRRGNKKAITLKFIE